MEKQLWAYQGKSFELPVKWDMLSKRQQELLQNRFPISGGYKILAFFFPWLYLLYIRRYGVFFSFLLLSFVPYLNVVINLVLRIWLVLSLEPLSYHQGSINMKNTLIMESDLWDPSSDSYWKTLIKKNVKMGCFLWGF